jgi:hypothetical protein
VVDIQTYNRSSETNSKYSTVLYTDTVDAADFHDVGVFLSLGWACRPRSAPCFFFSATPIPSFVMDGAGPAVSA